MFNLCTLVHDNMADLISAYGLRTMQISDKEVLLNAENYVIDVIAEKDGVSMIYFDSLSTPPKGYNLFLFLFNQRRSSLIFLKNTPPSDTFQEFVDSQLRLLSLHLRSAASDILGGEKGWIKDYRWPIVRPSAEILKMAQAIASLKTESATLSVR